MFVWAERDRRKRFPRAADAVTEMEGANAGVMVALVLTALLHALARLPVTSTVFATLGGLRFLESQNFLSGRPVNIGLWLFFGTWLAAGGILARSAPWPLGATPRSDGRSGPPLGRAEIAAGAGDAIGSRRPERPAPVTRSYAPA